MSEKARTWERGSRLFFKKKLEERQKPGRFVGNAGLGLVMMMMIIIFIEGWHVAVAHCIVAH